MPRRMHRAILPLTLPLLLLACGQSPSPTEDLGPYANGATYPWSYTAQPGRITPLTLDPGRNNLYYEPILSATNGWGPVEINRSNGEQAKGDGRTLTVQGRTWDVGYGVHADSELRFSLKSTLANVTCTKLDGFVGVDDEVGDRGSVVFQIFLNDTKVFDSGVMTGKDSAKFYSVDLQGRTDLRMVVTDGGDNLYYDHANWLQPTVHCEQSTGNPAPAPGGLDPTFDTDGKVNVGGIDAARAPDGSIVILGFDGSITRLSPTGTVVRQRPPLGGNDGLNALAVQPDGKIVAVGVRTDPNGAFLGSKDFLIVRFQEDLSIDPSFGDSGALILNLGSGIPNIPYSDDSARAVTVTPDGKILVGGSAYQPEPFDNPSLTTEAATFLRLHPDGTRDTTFGTNGVMFHQVPRPWDRYATPSDSVEELAVRPDGRIVAGVFSWAIGSTVVRVLQILPNGALDPAFGTNGTSDITGGTCTGYPTLEGLALLPNGDVVLGGKANRSPDSYLDIVKADGSSFTFTCFRFASAFSLDYTSTLGALSTTSDGKIIAVGNSSEGVSVARFGVDLKLDTSFGQQGVASVQASGQRRLGRVLIQPDSKIVVTWADSGTFRLNP